MEDLGEIASLKAYIESNIFDLYLVGIIEPDICHRLFNMFLDFVAMVTDQDISVVGILDLAEDPEKVRQ